MFLKRLFILTFALLLPLETAPAEAQGQKNLSFPLSHYELKNGMQVILSEDYSLPLVSVVVAYNVGSLNEQQGKTGLAYLLENLMFQGSQNVSQMQHISYINRIGGIPNADTKEDRTLFYQTVPSNQLALVLWLESDRMKSLDINPSNLEQAKEALIGEIQQRKANEPYLESFFVFDQFLFSDFAYSHPLIGSEEDIRNITVEDVKDFYSTFYVPNNAVLCIAGNMNKIKAKELLAKYFETILKGKDQPPLPPSKLPEKKEVIETLKDSLVPSPAFHLGYRIASSRSNDFYALTVLDYILLRSKSSRLYKRLIKKERLAYHLSGGIEKRKELATFKIFAINNNEAMVDLCQKAIFSEINKLKSSFIPEEELEKSKNLFKMDYLRRFATSLDRAIFLTETFLSQKNFENFPSELDRYLKVTPSEIVGIVNRYFTRENSVLLNIKMK